MSGVRLEAVIKVTGTLRRGFPFADSSGKLYGTTVRVVRNLEAVDGTPVIGVKALLSGDIDQL